MAMPQVIETEDGDLYIVRANTLKEIDKKSEILFSLDEFSKTPTLVSDYVKIFTILKKDVEYLKKTLQRTRDPKKLYSKISQIGYLTNFTHIEEFTKAVISLLETVNSIVDFNLFTRERRLKFLKNIKELLETVGYKLFVVDYTGDEIVFRIQHTNKELSQLYKIDATSYDKLESTIYLKDIMDDFETLKLLAPERKETIIEDLRIFKAT